MAEESLRPQNTILVSATFTELYLIFSHSREKFDRLPEFPTPLIRTMDPDAPGNPVAEYARLLRAESSRGHGTSATSARGGRLLPTGEVAAADVHHPAEPAPAGGAGVSVLRIRTAKETMDLAGFDGGAAPSCLRGRPPSDNQRQWLVLSSPSCRQLFLLRRGLLFRTLPPPVGLLFPPPPPPPPPTPPPPTLPS